jgi:membrane fusion protein
MAEPKTSASLKAGPAGGHEAELFPMNPPPWVARSLGWLLVLVFLAAAVGAVLIRVPETIRCGFVLVQGGGQVVAQLSVPEEAMAEVRVGLPVKLLFHAFPYQRYGARDGKIVAVSPTVTSMPEGQVFYATAQPTEQSIAAGGVSHAIRPGMRGEARVILGRRTLIDYVFEPIRRLKENMGGGGPG